MLNSPLSCSGPFSHRIHGLCISRRLAVDTSNGQIGTSYEHLCSERQQSKDMTDKDKLSALLRVEFVASTNDSRDHLGYRHDWDHDATWEWWGWGTRAIIILF